MSYVVFASPFAQFLEMSVDPEETDAPCLADVLGALSAHVGEPVSWDESGVEDIEDPWGVAAYCLFALKTVAGYHALRGNLEGFELEGEDPLDHPIWAELAEAPADTAYPQLVSVHAMDTSYVPARLGGVVESSWNMGDAPEEGEEEDAYVLLVGSLPELIEELHAVAPLLDLDPKSPPTDDVEFDVSEHPLAAAQLAWTILHGEATRATDLGIPLFVVYSGGEDEEEDEDEDGLPKASDTLLN